MYQKLTIRRMLPNERKLARILNDLDSVVNRLKKHMEKAHDDERDALALEAQRQAVGQHMRDAELSMRLPGDTPLPS